MLESYFSKVFIINGGIILNVMETVTETASGARIWVVALFRTMFAAIDRMMIWLIDSSFGLIMDIADAKVFNEMILELFGNRLYILIALFMLFKLSITLIRYMADPDSAGDKEMGMGNMVKKALIALLLLVLVPLAFQEAYRFQSFIIRNQTIATFILGVPQPPTDENARLLSFGVYSAFFFPNPDVVGDSCDHVYYVPDGLSEECRSSILAASKAGEDGDMELVVDVFDNAIQTQNAEYMMSGLLVEATTQDNNFVFTYQWILSGIIAFIVALILISFCFDIALRTVKLGFLQLIAPIPILASVDPKSKLLEKWFQTTIMTYVDLFIRLIAIFFAVFVIGLVRNNFDGVTRFSDGEPIESTLVILFVIIGTLLFAKQLPNLIADLLGTKFEGSMELNPLNRLKQVPGVGKAIGVTEGVVGGAAGGYIAGKASGTQWRGARHGALVGGLSGHKGIGMAGEEEGTKQHYSIYQSMQEAHKDYTGNEMARMRSEDIVKSLQGVPGIGRIAKWDQKAVEREMNRVNKPLNELEAMENSCESQATMEGHILSQQIGKQRQERARKRQSLISGLRENERQALNQELIRLESEENNLYARLNQMQSRAVTDKLKTPEERHEHRQKVTDVKHRLNQKRDALKQALQNRSINVNSNESKEYVGLQENFEVQNEPFYKRIDDLRSQREHIAKMKEKFNKRKEEVKKASGSAAGTKEFENVLKEFEKFKTNTNRTP